MEKDNCDLDFQLPKKKAKRTKVAIDKRFAEVKGADQVAEITKGYIVCTYFWILPRIPPGVCEYLKSGVVLETRSAFMMKYVVRMY